MNEEFADGNQFEYRGYHGKDEPRIYTLEKTNKGFWILTSNDNHLGRPEQWTSISKTPIDAFGGCRQKFTRI